MIPSTIDPNLFGTPTFDERWQTLDASEMAQKPATPARWRTVLGAGGPTKVEYRSGSAGSIYVDSTFAGVKDGVCQKTSLGLNPFKVNPGSYLAIQGSKTPAAALPLCFDKPYLGGVLTTKFSFAQLFGYFEIKANLPMVKGAWPAFWLLPTSGQWPANGELDIFEGLGATNKIWCSVHSGSTTPRGNEKEITLPFNVGGSGVWHTYGAAWTADEIVWYVDRKEVRRVPTPADMKSVPMYMLVNLAIGGSWGGYPDPTASFACNFMVNRVTAWKMP